MTVTLTLATILAVAGCGSSSGGSSNADPKDVAAVARQVADGNEFSKAQAQCVAEHATSKLSAKALKSAHQGSSDVSTLSKGDQEVIFTSVGACVKTAQMMPALSKAFESGSDKLDSKSAKCAERAVVSVYPNAGDLMRDMNAGKTTKFENAMLKCVMGGNTSASGSGASSGSGDSVFKDALIAEMTKGGLTNAQATCVADKVLAEVPTDDLAKVGTSGSLPADIESKVETAAVSCATGG